MSKYHIVGNHMSRLNIMISHRLQYDAKRQMHNQHSCLLIWHTQKKEQNWNCPRNASLPYYDLLTLINKFTYLKFGKKRPIWRLAMLVFAVMENNCLEERDSDWKNIYEYCGNMLLASSREMLENTCQVRSRLGSFWLGLYRKSGKLFIYQLCQLTNTTPSHAIYYHWFQNLSDNSVLVKYKAVSWLITFYICIE